MTLSTARAKKRKRNLKKKWKEGKSSMEKKERRRDMEKTGLLRSGEC